MAVCGRRRAAWSHRHAASIGALDQGRPCARACCLTPPAPSHLPPFEQAARQYRRMLRKGALYAGAGIGVVLVGYLAWRFVSQQKQAGGGEHKGSGGSSGDAGGEAAAELE